MNPEIGEQQVEQFREEGYFLTEPQFTSQELADVAEVFDELHTHAIAEAEKAGDDEVLQRVKFRPFIGQAHTRSPVLESFVKAPVYLEACHSLIGAA